MSDPAYVLVRAAGDWSTGAARKTARLELARYGDSRRDAWRKPEPLCTSSSCRDARSAPWAHTVFHQKVQTAVMNRSCRRLVVWSSERHALIVTGDLAVRTVELGRVRPLSIAMWRYDLTVEPGG